MKFFIFVDVFFARVWSELLDLLSTLSRFHLYPVNNSVHYPDEIPQFVEYFSFLPLLWSVECFVHAMTLLDVDLCVDNLSPALCKMTRHRKLLWQTSASECFLEWRLCFSEEKVFLSGCSPRASCFSEWRAGGSFEVQFRSTSFRC